MVNITEERISEKKYFSLGSFVDDELRGIIFSGMTRIEMNESQYFSNWLKDPETVLLKEGKVIERLGGFQLINGRIHWGERDKSGEELTIYSEDRLCVPSWYLHPFQVMGGKLVCVSLHGDRHHQTLWVDGVEGPMCEAIHDITLTSQGIGYTAFTEEGMDVMLNNERFGGWRGSHRLFEHNGKMGYVISRSKEGVGRYEGVIFDEKPYGELAREIGVHSINGRLITTAQEGYLFQSGTTNVPLLGGEVPTYDLSGDFGNVVFVDGERIGKYCSPDFEAVDGGIAMKMNLNNKVGDNDPNNHSTRILIMRDRQPTIDYTVQGEGSLRSIGGKAVFLAEYHTGEEDNRLYVEDKLVAQRPHIEHDIVDVDGQVGGIVSVEKGKGSFPAINGDPSGEQIPQGYHSYSHLHSEPFAGNVVISTGNIFCPVSHLVVGGQVFGQYLAVSEPVHKGEALEFIAAKEDGAYLLTFNR